MSHKVRIKAGLTNVQLPDGKSYDGGKIVTLTDDQFNQISTAANPSPSGSYALGDEVLDEGSIYLISGAAKLYHAVISIPLASIANGTVTQIQPGFAGTVYSWRAIVTTAATTASKTTTLNLDVNGTSVGTSASTLTITSAAATPVGATIAGTTVTGANTFGASDVISIKAASTTAFVEGQVAIYVVLLSN